MTAFDQLAPAYAELWSESQEGRRQREQFWKEIDGLFPRGSRALDIGCGIGDDALHLMSQGVEVVGIDASERMVEIARTRGVEALHHRFPESKDVWGRPLACGGLSARPFDGALSNFGVLNCASDPSTFATELATLLHPGSPVAICVMPRFSARETLKYTLKFDLRRATRRWSGHTHWRGMDIYYHSSQQIRRAFEPHFRFERRVPIGGGDHDFYLFRRA